MKLLILIPEPEIGLKPQKPNYLKPEDLTLLIRGHCSDSFASIRLMLQRKNFDFPDMNSSDGVRNAEKVVKDICLGILEIRDQDAANPYCVLSVTS